MWTVTFYDPATLVRYTELHDTEEKARVSAVWLWEQKVAVQIRVREKGNGSTD